MWNFLSGIEIAYYAKLRQTTKTWNVAQDYPDFSTIPSVHFPIPFSISVMLRLIHFQKNLHLLLRWLFIFIILQRAYNSLFCKICCLSQIWFSHDWLTFETHTLNESIEWLQLILIRHQKRPIRSKAFRHDEFLTNKNICVYDQASFLLFKTQVHNC